ncbi:hypothetical protein ACFL0M_04885 [Thermodesulfobacteriota bacterium]
MDDKCIFNCETCGNEMEVAASDSQVLECCGKPMQKVEDLPFCETSATAEHARLDDIGEPCDDGRAGKV